jgi:hypothetical protein
VTLAAQLASIRAGITAALEEADLGVVKSETETIPITRVIWGDRSRVGELEPPLIWVFPDDSQISHAGSAIAEEWSYSFIVAAMVTNDDPEQGYLEAEALAADASAALIADRSLGGAVRDMVRTRYLPGYSTDVATAVQLHWAAFGLSASFRHREEVN